MLLEQPVACKNVLRAALFFIVQQRLFHFFADVVDIAAIIAVCEALLTRKKHRNRFQYPLCLFT